MLSKRPFMLHVNNTNICNSNCSFCGYKYQTVPEMTMSMELFKKIIDEYDTIGGGRLSITPVVGEPMVPENILDHLEYASTKPSITMEMITNATLIDKYGADKLLGYINWWQISASGFDEDMYKRMFRTSGYQRVKRNVIDLLEANSKRDDPREITVSLRFDRPIEEVLNYPDFKEILKYRPKINFLNEYSDFGGLVTKEDLDVPVRFKSLRKKYGFRCFMAARGMCICPDGKVLACNCIEALNYPEDLVIGDITKEGLLDIWKGERRRDFLRSFNVFEKTRETCGKCKSYRPEYFLFRREVISEMKDNIERWGRS